MVERVDLFLARRNARQRGHRMGQHRALGAHLRQLRLRIGQLRIGAAHIDAGGNAAVIAVMRHIIGALIGAHGVRQDRDFQIGPAHRRPCAGQIGLKGKAQRGGVFGAGLRIGARGLHAVAHPAPQVQFIADAGAHRIGLVIGGLGSAA